MPPKLMSKYEFRDGYFVFKLKDWPYKPSPERAEEIRRVEAKMFRAWLAQRKTKSAE